MKAERLTDPAIGRPIYRQIDRTKDRQIDRYTPLKVLCGGI